MGIHGGATGVEPDLDTEARAAVPFPFDGALEHRLGVAPLGSVSDRGENEQPLLPLQRAERDLDGELGAVCSQPRQLRPIAMSTHRPHPRCCRVGVSMARMALAEPLGYEHLDRPAEKVVAVVAEEAFGLAVDELDRAALVDDDHGIGRRVDHRLEEQARAVVLGRVPARS
jgi:hypothetical protein